MGILGTIAKEATTETITPLVKKARTLAKNVPAEEEFVDVRLKDIGKEQQQTYIEGEKLKEKTFEKMPVIKEPLNAKQHEAKIKAEEYNTEIANKEAQLQEKKRDVYLKALQLKKEREVTELYKTQIAEGEAPNEAIKNIISTTTGVGRTFSNIEARTTALYNRVSKGMFELKDELRTKFAGVYQNKDLGDDVIRYLKDGTVKNQNNVQIASKIGKQWSEAAETLKAMRAKTGARIGKLEDWVMPQVHEKDKLRKSGFKQWREVILPKLDVERIEKQQGSNIEDVLKSAFKNITARDVEKGMGINGANVAKRNEQSRILHFKNGDSIIEYNQLFGSQDLFATMDAHMRVQTNEIAQMQIFGSNPESNFMKLIELAKNDGLGTIHEASLNRIWNVVSGKADGDNIVSKLDNTIANIGSVHRSMAIASKLGTATISSIADVGNIFLGGGYRGLNSFKIMGKGLHTMLQETVSGMATSKSHEFANRLMVVSEFANASLSNARFAEQGSGWFAKRAENVIRASGLGAWTDSLRTGFGLEFAGNMFNKFDKTLNKTGTAYEKMLREYGIDDVTWDKIRQTKAKEIEGAKFVDIEAIYKIDEELGYKVSEMISQEMDNFIIMPNARIRALTTGGSKKGTVVGEVTRNMALFKSYPATVMMLHLNRMGNLSKTGKVAYGSAAIVSSVVFGAVSLWARDLVKGHTPRDWDRKEMVVESLMQGGGLGIFGDMFVNPDLTRYGNSWGSTLLGVPSSTLEDIKNTMVDTTRGNPRTVANAYNRAKNYIPGQNLWYTRLLIERTLGKTVGEMLDPNFAKKQRKRKKALRLRGQKQITIGGIR